MSEARISVAEFERLARERVPFTQSIGAVIEDIQPGRLRARAPYREEFVRPGGTIAGPVLMALADLCMYGAVLSIIGPVELAVTTNLNINFLRRPPAGTIVAEASILKMGRRLAVGEVRLYSEESGDLVAHVTATYSIPPERE